MTPEIPLRATLEDIVAGKLPAPLSKSEALDATVEAWTSQVWSIERVIEEALYWQSIGYKIFFTDLNKIPLNGAGGFKAGTTDPDELVKLAKKAFWKTQQDWILNPTFPNGAPNHHAAWMREFEYPVEGIMVAATPLNGTILFDPDVKNGENGPLHFRKEMEKHIDMPFEQFIRGALIIETPSGGLHFTLRSPDPFANLGQTTEWIPGVDTRAPEIGYSILVSPLHRLVHEPDNFCIAGAEALQEFPQSILDLGIRANRRDHQQYSGPLNEDGLPEGVVWDDPIAAMMVKDLVEQWPIGHEDLDKSYHEFFQRSARINGRSMSWWWHEGNRNNAAYLLCCLCCDWALSENTCLQFIRMLEDQAEKHGEKRLDTPYEAEGRITSVYLRRNRQNETPGTKYLKHIDRINSIREQRNAGGVLPDYLNDIVKEEGKF